MPDLPISQLPAVPEILGSDLFPLNHLGQAMKLSADVLKQWLVQIANSLGGIAKVELISASGLVKTYRINFANETYLDFDVTDGEKGEPGDPATLLSSTVSYAVSASGTTQPSSGWQSTVPTPIAGGAYLWTRVTQRYNSGDPVVFAVPVRMGVDGTGAVHSVNGMAGNVVLSAGDVGAVATTGGTMTGSLALPAPTAAAHAANKGYVDTVDVSLTLLANDWLGAGPYTQTLTVPGLADGRRVMIHPAYGTNISANADMHDACACISYTKRSGNQITVTCLDDKPDMDIDIVAEVYV